MVAGRSRALNRAHGVGVGNDVKTAWAVHTQVLFAHVRPLVSYGVTCSETLPMRKLPTGEPYARKPHVRFAGRGGESLPDPYQDGLAHHILLRQHDGPIPRIDPSMRIFAASLGTETN